MSRSNFSLPQTRVEVKSNDFNSFLDQGRQHAWDPEVYSTPVERLEAWDPASYEMFQVRKNGESDTIWNPQLYVTNNDSNNTDPIVYATVVDGMNEGNDSRTSARHYGAPLVSTQTPQLYLTDNNIPNLNLTVYETVVDDMNEEAAAKTAAQDLNIDKVLTIPHKNIFRRNLHVVIPATLLLAGTIAFVAYWFTRHTASADSASPEESTTAAAELFNTLLQSTKQAFTNVTTTASPSTSGINATSENTVTNMSTIFDTATTTASNTLSAITTTASDIFSSILSTLSPSTTSSTMDNTNGFNSTTLSPFSSSNSFFNSTSTVPNATSTPITTTPTTTTTWSDVISNTISQATTSIQQTLSDTWSTLSSTFSSSSTTTTPATTATSSTMSTSTPLTCCEALKVVVTYSGACPPVLNSCSLFAAVSCNCAYVDAHVGYDNRCGNAYNTYC